MTFGVAKEFDEILQNAGIEIVIVDNDKKTHSKTHTPGCVSKNRTQTQTKAPLAFTLSIAFAFSQFCNKGGTI